MIHAVPNAAKKSSSSQPTQTTPSKWTQFHEKPAKTPKPNL